MQKFITMAVVGLLAWLAWYGLASLIGKVMRDHDEAVRTRLRSPGWVPARGLCGAGGKRNVKREGGAK